jgi:hypothetical protein
MKVAFCYHRPEHPNPIRRQDLHHGVMESADVASALSVLKARHPGETVTIRYAMEAPEGPVQRLYGSDWLDINRDKWYSL